MIRIGINGAAGRMGTLLVDKCIGSTELWLGAVTDRGSCIGKDVGHLIGIDPTGLSISPVTSQVYSECQVVIDFSLPEGTGELIHSLSGQGLIVGTTGLSKEVSDAIAVYARTAPVVMAANFSTGVNVLLGIVQQAAALLPDHDIEIVEMHHSQKQDSPSGTALALATAAQNGRKEASEVIHGRSGHVGARPKGEIAIHAVRGGDVAGEHTVYLAGAGERLTLGHLATSREAFVDGALVAAKWCAGKAPGLYGMQDVLGLR
jgi:4-hydroxy-tetrahydrodipicolinate reductase